MPTPAESGFRHVWSTMPKLRVGMPPTILAIMPQMAKMLQTFTIRNSFYRKTDHESITHRQRRQGARPGMEID